MQIAKKKRREKKMLNCQEVQGKTLEVFQVDAGGQGERP